MHLEPRNGLWPFLALVCFVPALQAGGIPSKTLKELKAASVFIKVQSAPPGGAATPGGKAKLKPIPLTGSGFVVHVEGGAGFIATNLHVVSPLAGEVLEGKPQVVFFSGTPKEKTVDADILASDASRDLAILKVAGFDGLPKPIPMDTATEVDETMTIYAFGFPFGEQLALGKGNPGITITKGTVSALRYDNQGQVKLVQIDAEVNPGNSGGPIVDEKGKLLGVAVSKIMKTRTIGFAIPVKALAEMMQGKVAWVLFETLKVDQVTAHIRVEAGLIDPLGKLKDLSLRYRLADAKEPAATEDKLPKDAGVTRLTIDKGKGHGKIMVKGTGADKVPLAYQASFVNAAGQAVVLPISKAVIDFTQVVYSEHLTRSDFTDSHGKPLKYFTHKMKAGKQYVIDMRGDPKDLDPRISVRDSEGKVLAEDDGSGGIMDALLVVAPPKDGEYEIVAGVTRGSGPFTLRIREDTGRELGAKGWTTAGKLALDDPLDPVMQAPAQSFNLMLKKGKHYTMDLKSGNFDPYLRVENMANVNLKTEDIGGGGHSTLFLSPFRDGIYRVVATSYDFKAGPYDFQIRESAGPKRYEVEPKGLKLADTLTGMDALDVVNGQPTNFRCKVFELKMKGGDKYQIDMTSTQLDPFLRIEDMRGKQLASDDDSGGMLNARLIFTPPADGVYRLVATQFDARLGNFELVVRPLPR